MRRYEWNCPAKLFHWPAIDGGEEEHVYPTLCDAIEAAQEGDAATAWIVCQNGDILSPKLIELLREEVREQPRRRSSVRSLFAWARAA